MINAVEFVEGPLAHEDFVSRFSKKIAEAVVAILCNFMNALRDF